MIHIGFSEGKSVDVPLLHTIVAAQTRYGKSTTIRGMMQYVPDDYKVVCLDVKDPRDFAGAGVEIPIYIENKTDPLMLKQLLEQESHLWLRREFPELISLCKKGDTFEKVYKRVKERMKEKVHPVVRDRLKVLRLLLEKLVSNMAKVEMSDKLELPAKKNVMNLSKAPSEIKQLGVYSTIKEVLTRKQNVILVIDELPDFAPQRYRTPSKSMIGQAIRKGGAKQIWLWLSGQTMTGVDKQVLKQAMIWILGHQREINEARRTLDQIPFKTGLKVEDIMTLPVGHFIVCTDEGAYITYVQPEGVDAETARKVSIGELPVNEVSEMLKKGMEVDDLVWKEKYEKLKQELDGLKVERNNLAKIVEQGSKGGEELRKTIGQLRNQLAVSLKARNQFREELANAKADLETFDKLREIIGEVLLPIKAEQMKKIDAILAGPRSPSEMVVVTEQPALTVQRIRKPLKLSQQDLEGRIAIVYAEGLLPKDKAFTTTRLNKIMEQRFGTKEFPGNFRKVLPKFVAWGFFEKVQSGRRWDYKVRMKPGVAREKGLLKVEEKKNVESKVIYSSARSVEGFF